jgi:hypothetical protein
MSFTPFFEGSATNYMEVHLGQKKTREHVFQARLDPDVFYKYMSVMKNFTSFKFFKTYSKEYILNNLHLVKQIKDANTPQETVEDVRVNDMTLLTTHLMDDRTYVLCYDKKKIPIVAYPSTQDINDVKYVNKLIFRVNNRIFVNFQQEKSLYDMDNVIHRVYINYNHSSNVDINESFKVIDDVLTKLQESTC